MDTDEHVRREIDRSFGEGPSRLPDGDLLARGHRALARRRIAVGAVAAAVVAAVGGTTLAAAGIDDAAGPRRPGYAASPSAAPSPSASRSTAVQPAPTTPSVTPPSQAEFRRALRTVAVYDDSGRLLIAPQATVLDRVAHPYRAFGPGRSVALVLDFHGYTYWAALYRAPDGRHSTSVTWSGEQDSTFEAWVRDQRSTVAADGASTSAGSDVWPGVPNPDLVRFVGSTERLRPLDGVRILRQADHVSVGDSFAGPTDQTAAALVEAADGERSYVLARRFDGRPPQYIGVPVADGGPTLAAFLDLARAKYAPGGGGLL
jgi:hypothetical protein